MITLPRQAQKEKEKLREKRIELMFRKLNIQKEIKQIDEDLVLLKEAIKKLDDFQKLFKKDW